MAKQLKEHISKIMSKSNYVLESPSYRAIIDDDYDTYDDPNALVSTTPSPVDGTSPLREADPIPGEEEDPMGDLEQDALGGDPAAEMGGEAPPPEGGMPDEIPSPEGGEPMADPMAGEEAPAPAGEVQTPSPDELQNEIIQKNIDVMRQLNQKIEDLEVGIDQLNVQNQEMVFKTQEMEKEVEEVREPTNVEKLMTKKEDSHPYYYGLNDMWKGNWFQARRDETGDKGMKELDDGSYVADFDEMDQMNDMEIKDSFDNY